MSKNSGNRAGGSAERYAYTQNRELSWLRFNQRVLEEAADRSDPPMERLKFIAIFSSNLDEFFMVRVGSLFDISQLSPEEEDNKTGMTAEQQLEEIYRAVPGLIEQKKELYASVCAELRQRGVQELEFSELRPDEQKYISHCFQKEILPVLSPIIVGSHHPAPHLGNKRLYAAALLRDKKGRGSLGLITIPPSLPPYFRLPGEEVRYIRTETIILRWADSLFGSYQVQERCLLSVTRNADLSFDEEKFEDSEEDFLSRVMKRLKKRDSLSVVRLELSCRVSEEFLSRLTRVTQVEPRQIYVDTCPLNMSYVYRLIDELSPEKAAELLYRPYQARWPEDLRRERGIIEQIQQRDRMLFYPFDSVEPFLQLLTEAAERPDVLSIKITIYRLASSSRIARLLCRAAENGKEVVVLMELRARFDEANNITWSRVLEEAGCQVVYGVRDFKCHSKLCLITLRGKGALRYITQVGTGNYNEKTNAMYTDLSMMTASNEIGEDATAFFRNMLVNDLDGHYQRLLVAPAGIKSAICRLIDGEIARGSEGYVCIKANAVTEREVIDKLRQASQAGVEVQLIIRGICCLLPGVPGQTDNVHVTSIVGRYLEHARIYCFGRGEEARLYISSADMMTRNLNRRVEIACPVEDAELKDMLRWILSCQLRDNVKASQMLPDGRYFRKQSQPPLVCDSQQRFMEQSPHKPAPLPPVRSSLRIRLGALLKQMRRS